MCVYSAGLTALCYGTSVLGKCRLLWMIFAVCIAAAICAIHRSMAVVTARPAGSPSLAQRHILGVGDGVPVMVGAKSLGAVASNARYAYTVCSQFAICSRSIQPITSYLFSFLGEDHIAQSKTFIVLWVWCSKVATFSRRGSYTCSNRRICPDLLD